MAMSGGKDDGSPMMEMNTTPLIDVMLVLLIMMILSIPPATHSVNIDLPVPNPNPPPDMVDPIKNKIVLTPTNEILWNGEAISQGIGAVLDVANIITGAWTLEVSSPGIDRPLTRVKDWNRFAGHLARAEMAIPVEGRRRLHPTQQDVQIRAFRLVRHGPSPVSRWYARRVPADLRPGSAPGRTASRA